MELDDATVEAAELTARERTMAEALYADEWTEPKAEYGPEWHKRFPWWMCVRAARVAAAALPDPRPTEAEVYEGFRGEVPVRGWDIWEYLRGLGCFRPEPAAEPGAWLAANYRPTIEPVPAAEPPTNDNEGEA